MRIRKRRKDGSASPPLDPVAGNGLLDRRALLGQGIVLAGAITTGASTALTSAAAEPLTNGPWSLTPAVPIPPYGQPSKFEQKGVLERGAGLIFNFSRPPHFWCLEGSSPSSP
jgi:sulfane dehydrogenase subunit SoxC